MTPSLIGYFEIFKKAPKSTLAEKDHLPNAFYWSIPKVISVASVPLSLGHGSDWFRGLSRRCHFQRVIWVRKTP